MNWLRRALLELWALVPLSLVVGFLGPFGTYGLGDLFSRWGRWWGLLMGAYVVVRPTLALWRWIAHETRLPQGSVMLCGMTLASFPLALLWELFAHREAILIGSYSALLPFTLLCSLAVYGIVWWAHGADVHLQKYYRTGQIRQYVDDPNSGLVLAEVTPLRAAAAAAGGASPALLGDPSARPRLYARLGPRFEGEVLALESEDHYVRVHGARVSQLLLLRLRDAITEMDDSPGEQVHRSWWVARDAVARVVGVGRNREILLVNGTRAPVARDSIDRLQRVGFLPSTEPSADA